MRQTCRSVKLALRTVHAKLGTGEDCIRCGLPPKIWDKLWCAVRLNSPLKHEPVKPEEVLRSRPEGLRAVLGEDADKVLKACETLLDNVRDVFDRECGRRTCSHVTPAQKKNGYQSRPSGPR